MRLSRAIKIFLYIIVLIPGLTFPNFAASSADSLFTIHSSIRVDSIFIKGNETTEDYIILRELTFSEGDVIDSISFRFNQERVFSLGLFSKVDFVLVNKNEQHHIIIDVIESWYLFPYPFITLREKSLKKANYGLSLLYRNFRGRNETLRATAGIGYDKFFSIYYDNPSLFYKDDIGILFSLNKLKWNNRSVLAEQIAQQDFYYDLFSTWISFYKRINQFNTAAVTGGFTYLEASVKTPGITLSGTNIDRVIAAGTSYSLDTRGLKQYSENGIYAGVQLMNYGFGINNINYRLFDYDLRVYKNIYHSLITKARVAGRSLYGKNIPLHDRSFLGYDYFVRGYSNIIREGDNVIISSLEFSYPIIKDFFFSLDLPLIPKNLTSADFSVYISTFIDAGSVFEKHKFIPVSGYYYGYGLGITILAMPYNAIRFEFAMNQNGKGEFLIGSGFSF